MHRTSRLGLERLETRDVPAVIWYSQNFDTTAVGSLADQLGPIRQRRGTFVRGRHGPGSEHSGIAQIQRNQRAIDA